LPLASDEAKRVSRLIGDIYDASLDPALWPSVLEKICSFVEGQYCVLYSQDAMSKTGYFSFSWGDDPYYSKLYLEKYMKLNPGFARMTIGAKTGELLSNKDIMPVARLLETRYAKEWGRPQGLIDVMTAILDKSATAASALSVLRHERHGLVDAGTRRRMGLIAPHVRRAVEIGKIMDLRRIEAAAFADVLDALAAAVFLVDADANIVYVNESGRSMLDDAQAVRSADGVFHATDAQADQTLREGFAAAAQGDEAVGVKCIAVPLPAMDGSLYVAHVMPLTSGARHRTGLTFGALAAVCVRQATLATETPMEAMAKLYRLTQAELRVLFAIIEVGTIPETAPVLGISEATVKTHLRHIFEKTGASRQADLVKLVASVANPFGGLK
jgi:DNA-binding CsgD family transcriptional regulator/PAS domain-containing protein